MRIIAIDDEVRPLNLMGILLSDIEGAELIASFSNPIEALEYIRHVQIDLAFVDVEMPEMSGIDFARETENLPQPPQIVFVTAYSNYAMDAWNTNAVDYILKPYDRQQLIRALGKASRAIGQTGETPMEVRCFPGFELLVDGKPVVFHSKRAKELLAYLVHHQGTWVGIGMLVYDIFGDMDEKSSKSHYRVILSRLKQTLAAYNLDRLIQTDYGKIRVELQEDCCDYYRYLHGRKNLFTGDYMQEYSWAETEAARLRGETGRQREK